MRLLSKLPIMATVLSGFHLQAGVCQDFVNKRPHYPIREVTRSAHVTNQEKPLIQAAVRFANPSMQTLTLENAIRIFFDTFNYEHPQAGSVIYYAHPTNDKAQIARVSYSPDDVETGLLFEISSSTVRIGTIESASIHCSK